MKISIVIFLIHAAMATAVSVRFASSFMWDEFKADFNKKYSSLELDQKRREVFEENLRKIEKHNLEADSGTYQFRLGINEYSDLTPAEYRKLLLGLRPNATHRTTATSFLPPNNVTLPDEVDWRKHGYVTEVKNQGECGSCWAFSMTGTLEGQQFKKTGKLVSLSEQQLIDCSNKKGYRNHGCQGGVQTEAYDYTQDNGGIDTEKSYPYKAQDQECRHKKKDVGATVTGHVRVSPGEKNLQIAVATVGPISVSIDASQDSFQHYKSGVYYDRNCDSFSLNHAVLAVGYGRTSGDKPEEFWIVKNSWGRSWGMNGYILMSRNRKNNCGIAVDATYPLV